MACGVRPTQSRNPTLLVALLLLFLARDAHAQKCGRHASHIACGAFQGILYSVNNRWPPVQVVNLTDWVPLQVPDEATLSITLCNYGNFRVHDVTIRNVTIVPPLVASVGKKAVVRVHVYNSANLDVSGRLVIGYPMPTVSGDRSYGGEDTSIISNVVRGPVSDGSSIVVDVSKSANVRLRSGTRDLWMAKATLLNELINGAHDFNMHCFVDACFEVRVWDSANIDADQQDGPNVIIQDGQLDDESIDTGCIGKGTFVRVVKRNVANVRGVRNLHIWDGELSDEALDALHIREARAEVSVQDSANVFAHHVEIIEGELIDEMVDARDLVDAEVSVLCMNSGNIRAQSVEIVEGELVDESVDVRDVLRSTVVVTLKNSGNVRVQDLVSIQDGELVDEVLDANALRGGYVDISIVNTSNVLCGPGAVSMQSAELLESVIDVADMRNVKAALFISDSANVHVPADWIHMREAKLAEETVDVDLVNGGLKLTVTRSMGNGCARCMGYAPTCVFKGHHNSSAKASPPPRLH